MSPTQEASTEQLPAVVHYRALFADLLGAEPVRHHPDEPRPDAPQDATSR